MAKDSPAGTSAKVLAKTIVETKIAQLKQQMQDMVRSQKALDELFETELTKAKEVFPYETEDDRYKRSLDRAQFLYDNLIKRMEELDIVSGVGGFDSRVITPPEPGEKVFPKLLLVLPVALILGLMAGFGMGYLAAVPKRFARGWVWQSSGTFRCSNKMRKCSARSRARSRRLIRASVLSIARNRATRKPTVVCERPCISARVAAATR
jgi:hypothetical protein